MIGDPRDGGAVSCSRSVIESLMQADGRKMGHPLLSDWPSTRERIAKGTRAAGPARRACGTARYAVLDLVSV
jgi:hypothetical protein